MTGGGAVRLGIVFFDGRQSVQVGKPAHTAASALRLFSTFFLFSINKFQDLYPFVFRSKIGEDNYL